VTPGENYNLGELKVKTIPAYNIGKQFHPKQNNWVGYVITLSTGQRIYHSGDTDFTPEIKTVVTDFALLPIGGTYTMTAKEAAEAAKAFKPQAVIPMHWGDIVGAQKDADEFKRLFPGKTIVMSPER
jgi:L-ascorbate metabolism protein UlaG (beta-lactamase superfamily)